MKILIWCCSAKFCLFVEKNFYLYDLQISLCFLGLDEHIIICRDFLSLYIFLWQQIVKEMKRITFGSLPVYEIRDTFLNTINLDRGVLFGIQHIFRKSLKHHLLKFKIIENFYRMVPQITTHKNTCCVDP